MVTKKQNTEMGIVLALAMLICTLLFEWTKGIHLAIILLLLTILFPKLLTPISWIWFKLAKALEYVFSRIVLTVIYGVIVIPVSFLRRMFSGHDHLHLRRFKKETSSVFQDRNHTYTSDDLDKQY